MLCKQHSRRLSVSGNHTFIAALAACKVLSPNISYYTLSACIRTSTRPVHDVLPDEMWLAETETLGYLCGSSGPASARRTGAKVRCAHFRSLPEQFLIPKLNSPVTASLSAYHREAAGIGSGEAPSYSHARKVLNLRELLFFFPLHLSYPWHMNQVMKSKDSVEKTGHERRIGSLLNSNLM